MPQPTAGQVHVDAILTNISVAYMQSQANFVADKVFPIVPVDKRSDKYFTYTKGDWFRDEAKRRYGGDESAGSGYGLSTATYSCDVFAIHKDIDDQTRGNADAPLNLDRDATEFVTQRLMLRRELQWVTDYFGTGIWGTDATPGILWDNANSDPITDVDTGKQTILLNTGFEPNTLVLGWQVWRQLKNHPDIVDRYKYTSADSITPDMVARLFEVDRILVAKAVQNTGKEGGSDSFAFTHGKHALLCYANPQPSLLMPSAGYTFSWRNGVSAGMGYDIGIRNFRMEQLISDRIEGQVAFDHKVVATDLAYFFNGAVS